MLFVIPLRSQLRNRQIKILKIKRLSLEKQIKNSLQYEFNRIYKNFLKIGYNKAFQLLTDK